MPGWSFKHIHRFDPGTGELRIHHSTSHWTVQFLENYRLNVAPNTSSHPPSRTCLFNLSITRGKVQVCPLRLNPSHFSRSLPVGTQYSHCVRNNASLIDWARSTTHWHRANSCQAAVSIRRDISAQLCRSPTAAPPPPPTIVRIQVAPGVVMRVMASRCHRNGR